MRVRRGEAVKGLFWLAIGALAIWVGLRAWRARRGPAIVDSRRGVRRKAASPARGARSGFAASPSYTLAKDSAGLQVEEDAGDGLYEDVASMLEQQLAAHPARTDLHATLLDMYHGAGRTRDFLRSAKMFSTKASTDQWRRTLELGRELRLDLSGLRTIDEGDKDENEGVQHRVRRTVEDVRGTDFAADSPSTASADAGTGAESATPMQPQRRLRYYDHESLDAALMERQLARLRDTYRALRRDPKFLAAYNELVTRVLARPVQLHEATLLTARVGGARIFLKREDLRPVQSERLFNALGQCLIARFGGYKKLICGSVDGGSARAYAASARRLGLSATIFVPDTPELVTGFPVLPGIEWQRVPGVGEGWAGDPRAAALVRWLESPEETYYATGLKAGPDPYPTIVSDLQAICGQEVLHQLSSVCDRLPTAVVAGVETGFASVGLLQPFLRLDAVALALVQPGAHGAQPDSVRRPLRREHSWLSASGRVRMVEVDAAAADAAAALCAELEDVRLHAHNARALAHGMQLARGASPEATVVVLVGPQDESRTAG